MPVKSVVSALGVVVLASVVLTAPVARADPPPRFAVSGDYSLLYARFRYSDLHEDTILHGATLGLQVSLKSFFGLEAEISGQWAPHCVAWHAGLGPRVAADSDRFVPFARVLVGATGSRCETERSDWWYESAFALIVGGGVDYRLHPRVAVRLGLDYILGAYQPGVLQQVRFLAGVVVGISGRYPVVLF